jgi:hypothetical protein
MNLLLIALLVQDKIALDSFKKAEESLEKAKTLQVVISRTSTSKPLLTLKLKEGNKLCLRVEEAGGTLRHASVFSDGNEMSITTPPSRLANRRKTPPSLEAAAKVALFRGGFDGLHSLIEGLLRKADESDKGFDFKTMFGVSELARTDPGDATETFHFTLTKRVTWRDPILGESGWVGVRLRVKSDGSQLLDRAESGVGKVSWSDAETYKEFILNADIPDETFKFPEEKK